MIEVNLETIARLCKQAITRDIWYRDAECTKRFQSVFSEFADKLGYRAQLEFHTIDMVWWSNGRMVAAIEHENSPWTNPIENEWRKLVYIDADHKILISYSSSNNRKDWLKKASEIVARNPRGRHAHYYLVLGDETIWGFRGYEFDDSGKLKNEV